MHISYILCLGRRLLSKIAWVCAACKGMLFQTSSLDNGIFFGHFSLGKGMLQALLVKEKSNFGSFYEETNLFWSRECENLAMFA